MTDKAKDIVEVVLETGKRYNFSGGTGLVIGTGEGKYVIVEMQDGRRVTIGEGGELWNNAKEIEVKNEY